MLTGLIPKFWQSSYVIFINIKCIIYNHEIIYNKDTVKDLKFATVKHLKFSNSILHLTIFLRCSIIGISELCKQT